MLIRMSPYSRESNVNVRYAAPEVIARLNSGRGGAPTIDADQASDMYSLGVVMFEVLSGSAPWGSTPDSAVAAAVASGKGLRVVTDGYDALSIAVASIVEECLAYDAARRPMAAVVYSRLMNLSH